MTQPVNTEVLEPNLNGEMVPTGPLYLDKESTSFKILGNILLDILIFAGEESVYS